MAATRPEFEAARSLGDLKTGAALAQDRAEAAAWVEQAIVRSNEPRDLLTSFGLLGMSVDTIVEEAVAAAISGDVEQAVNKSSEVIQRIDDGSSSGSLRLVGIVVFGILALAVALALWYLNQGRAMPPTSGPGGRPWAGAA